MSDWQQVVVNSLWIVGLAVIVAALSYHDWLAHRNRVRLRDVLATSSWQQPFSAGIGLVCLGLALTGRVWWEHLVWAALGLAFGWQLIRSRRLK